MLWDGTYDLSSLSEKTRKSSNHLDKNFLLSYLKTQSVGPDIWALDLLNSSPLL